MRHAKRGKPALLSRCCAQVPHGGGDVIGLGNGGNNGDAVCTSAVDFCRLCRANAADGDQRAVNTAGTRRANSGDAKRCSSIYLGTGGEDGAEGEICQAVFLLAARQFGEAVVREAEMQAATAEGERLRQRLASCARRAASCKAALPFSRNW